MPPHPFSPPKQRGWIRIDSHEGTPEFIEGFIEGTGGFCEVCGKTKLEGEHDETLNPIKGTETFDAWWERDGRYIDPDTSDVPWFDKRRELCSDAYDAGSKNGITRALKILSEHGAVEGVPMIIRELL